jgi:hypothetical protein
MIGDGDCGEIGGMKIGGETEVLGENLPQRHFAYEITLLSVYSPLLFAKIKRKL